MTATVVDGGLRSVSIATQVLDCFRQRDELGPTQVARDLGVAKSTAHAMLSALAASGLVERTASGRYRLGLRLFDYAQLALERLPLRQAARPALVELHETIKEMVQLGIPSRGHVLYVERVGNGGLGPLLSGEVLRRVPGYASSAGRAMAAFDDAVAAATLALPRRRQTPFTVVDEVRLGRILDAARRSGWVRTSEESAIGYTSVAAPVFVPGAAGVAAVGGAISVVGTSAHLAGIGKDFYVAAVRAAAHKVSELMMRTAEA